MINETYRAGEIVASHEISPSVGDGELQVRMADGTEIPFFDHVPGGGGSLFFVMPAQDVIIDFF